MHLNQLAMSTLPDEYIGQAASSYVPHPGQTVALATLRVRKSITSRSSRMVKSGVAAGFDHPAGAGREVDFSRALIEYAVITYGRERRPELVAGLGQHDSWGTLIPAVYGVSAAEFEAGWQAYLTAHYGVLSPLSPHLN